MLYVAAGREQSSLDGFWETLTAEPLEGIEAVAMDMWDPYVSNETAVPKQPVLVVAAYSALLLASLIAFGVERGLAYAALPKWRRNARRPSCLDLITLPRKEMAEHPHILASYRLQPSDCGLVAAAAA